MRVVSGVVLAVIGREYAPPVGECETPRASRCPRSEQPTGSRRQTDEHRSDECLDV